MNVPTFFFSYARQDDESAYLSRFFNDLEKRVANWAGHSLQDSPLGTIDLRIELAGDWNKALTSALRHDTAFVMAETPLYYRREICGKELAAFLRRSPSLAADSNGALTGAQNVFRVRWMPQEAYGSAPQFAERTPAILRRIQYVPPHDLEDEERAAAIRRYKKKGMKKCVDQQPHYDELLDAFASAIVAAAPLPPGPELDIEAEMSAFEGDWADHLSPAEEEGLSAPIEPSGDPLEGLRSGVVFHLTKKLLFAADVKVPYADLLISEAVDPPQADPAFANFLSEIREAATEENLRIYNVAPASSVPLNIARLAEQIMALDERGIITIVAIDADWFEDQPSNTAISALWALGQAIRGWSGSALIVDHDANHAHPSVVIEEALSAFQASPLTTDRTARVSQLRRALINARGRALRALSGRSIDAQPIPLLRGVDPEK